MTGGGVSSVTLGSDGGAGIRAATILNGRVEVDPSGHTTGRNPSHQQEDVEHPPGNGGDSPLESKVEERRQDEGQDGGSQTAH